MPTTRKIELSSFALLAIVALEQVKAMRVEAVRRRTETTRD